MPAFDAHKNLAVSTVATAPSPATSGTSLVVQSGQGTRFPAVPFNATIWPTGQLPEPSNSEIVRVTAVSTDTLTISRAQEGTTARSVIVGDLIAATITAKALTDIENGYLQIVSKTANYTATLSDDVILVDAGSGAVTIALPAASTASGKRYTIKKTDVGTNAVTVDPNGSETIDGATTLAIAGQGDAYTIVSNGTAWWII